VVKVAGYVPAEFGSPITQIRFWLASDFAGGIVMLMPEAPMHQDQLAPRTENQIGFAGKVLIMEAVAVAEPVNQTPHSKLRLHPFTTDAPHVLATAFWR
jgi:hypothetical protein